MRLWKIFTLLGLILIFAGCNRSGPAVITLDTETNSELFPYTFDLVDVLAGLTLTAILPADFEGNGEIESVHIFDYSDLTRPIIYNTTTTAYRRTPETTSGSTAILISASRP